MANFVDYSTEDLNGTPVHTFYDAAGTASPPMFGPEADGLAQNIAQFKAYRESLPDNRVAGPGGGENEAAGVSEGPAMSMPAEPGMSPNPGAGMGIPPTAPLAPGYSQADADNARAEQSAIANNAAAADQARQQRALVGAARGGNLLAASADPAAAQAFINRPNAGVSREQLARRAQTGVLTPKSADETIEGAQPYDTDAAEARAQANLDLRLAKQQQADLLSARAEREAQMLDSQAAQATVRMQQEQRKQQAIEDGVQHDMSIAREYRDQVARQQVDPGRLFSGDRGAFNTIAAVVGQALGAFAAAGGGSPTVNGRRAAAGGVNYAKQIIDGAIDRDIRAQEVNIRAGQEKAQNQLYDIYRRVGDLNQAKSILRQQQQDYAGLQMRALAARDGSQDAQLAFDQWDAENAADRAEQERKFLADSYGKHTLKVASQYAYPQAGGGPTANQQLERMKLLAQVPAIGLEQEQASANLDKTRADTAKTLADAEAQRTKGTADDPTQINDYAKQSRQNDMLREKIRAFVSEHGGQIDEQGNITGLNAPLDFYGGDAAKVAKAKSDLTALGRMYAGVLNPGGEPSDKLLERVTPELGRISNGSAESSLSSMWQTLNQQQRALDASVSGQTRGRRAGNAQGSSLERLRAEQATREGVGAGTAQSGIVER